MTQIKTKGTWNEADIANADAALDAIIDAAATIAGSVTTIHVDAIMWIRATDGSTGKYNFMTRIVACSNAAATLKTHLGAFWLEFEDMHSETAKYATLASVDGRAVVTVDY